MDFLGAACDVRLVLLHVCCSQLPAPCLCRGHGARERAISLLCTDGTSAVATLTGDRDKKNEVEEWHLCPSAEVLQEILPHKGSPLLVSLSRNFSNPNPGNLSQASRGSSSLTNRARLWDKGDTRSSYSLTAEILARARVGKDKCHFRHSNLHVHAQIRAKKLPLNYPWTSCLPSFGEEEYTHQFIFTMNNYKESQTQSLLFTSVAYAAISSQLSSTGTFRSWWMVLGTCEGSARSRKLQQYPAVPVACHVTCVKEHVMSLACSSQQPSPGTAGERCQLWSCHSSGSWANSWVWNSHEWDSDPTGLTWAWLTLWGRQVLKESSHVLPSAPPLAGSFTFLAYTGHIEGLNGISSEDKSKTQSSLKQGRLDTRKTFLRTYCRIKSLQRWSNLNILPRPLGILSRHCNLPPMGRLTSASNKVHMPALQ